MVILGKRIAALLRRSNPTEKVDVWTCGDLTVNFSGYSAHDASGELEVTAAEITAILKESAHKSGKCVVIVTHSNELAKEADVVFQLRKGDLQIAGPSDVSGRKGCKN